MTSIAYNDATSDKQRLLRFVGYDPGSELPNEYRIWDHYVKEPDATTIRYTSDCFSTEPIYLQDVTDANKVGSYGIDLVASRPLSLSDGMVKVESTPARQYRTATDARNAKARNCVYNRATWQARSFVTDMWNAPVLMFRVAAVYDRGDNDYATQTLDGHTLTLYHARTWKDDNYDAQECYDIVMSGWTGMLDDRQNYTLDGKKLDFPTWRQAWGN